MGRSAMVKKYIWEEVYKDKKYMLSVYKDTNDMGSSARYKDKNYILW